MPSGIIGWPAGLLVEWAADGSHRWPSWPHCAPLGKPPAASSCALCLLLAPWVAGSLDGSGTTRYEAPSVR